jgi:alpha-1,2-glucosyltransferase
MSHPASPSASKPAEAALTVAEPGREPGFTLRSWGAGLILVTALLIGLVSVLRLPAMADEAIHAEQIRRFARGDWTIVEWLTTIPGYHAIIAGISHVAGKASVPAMRLYSFLLSIAALVVLFLLCRGARDGRAPERILQIAFLPILFPLFFLIYTDVASVLFLAAALFLHERRHYSLAGVAGFLGVLIRQSNILWVGYLSVLLAKRLLELAPPAAGATARRHVIRLWPVARAITVHGAAYILTIGAFLAFVVVNGGVAIGDRDMHPFPGVYLSNIYFALFLTFVFFLPLHLVQLREIARIVLRPRMLIGVAAFVPLFLYTFTPDHPYNQLDFWLHNRLLMFFGASTATKLLLLVPALVAVFSLAAVPFRGQSKMLLFAFSAMSLLVVWHVEQRYYIVPMVLFLLFREQRTLRFEWAMAAYLAVLAAALHLTLRSGAAFP